MLLAAGFDYHFPTWASLAVIAVVLTVAILASLRAEVGEADPDKLSDPHS